MEMGLEPNGTAISTAADRLLKGQILLSTHIQ